MTVKNVFIGNKDRPLIFSFAGVKAVGKVLGVPYFEMMQRFSGGIKDEDIPIIVWVGLAGGAISKGQSGKFDLKTIEKWVDQMHWMKITNLVLDAMDAMPQTEESEDNDPPPVDSPTDENVKN